MSTDDLKTVTLAGSDGSVSTVLMLRAEGSERGVLVSPALGIPEAYYVPLLRALRARGLSAAVLGAPRWPGKSRVRPPRYGYAELALDLVPRALALLDVPREGRFILGHSLGGAVAGIHAGHNDDIAGIALIAAGTPYHPMFKGRARARTMLGTEIIGAVATVFDFFPGDKLGFGGRMSGKLAREWSRFGRTGELAITSASGERVDAEGAFKRVDCPVLAVVLAEDELAPEPAVRHLVDRFEKARVTVRTYVPPAGHKEPDHNRWPRDPEPFADIVAAFVRASATRSAPLSGSLPHVSAA